MAGCWRLIGFAVGGQLLLVADVRLPVVRAFAPAVGERPLLVVGAFALAAADAFLPAVGERLLLAVDAFALAAADAFLPVVGERLLLVAHAWRQLVLLRRGPEPRSRLLAALLAFAPRVVVAQ